MIELIGEIGLSAEGSGPPVVWLHAFPLDRTSWDGIREAMADDFHTITPDFPGFGGSDATGPLTIDRMAEFVVTVLTHWDVEEPVHLGGCSMGGYVAMAFARKYPEHLKSLILVDTKAGADDATARASREQQIADLNRGVLTPAGLVEKMLPRLLGPAAPETVKDHVRQLGSRASVPGLTTAIAALRDRPDALPGLAAVRVPTLIVVGEQDVITPVSEAETLHRAIAGSRLVVLPGVGHLPHLEAPGLFVTAVREFLK
ncbi:MAG: alpha/beta fold hydrolase [Gemmataceae bacterium]